MFHVTCRGPWSQYATFYKWFSDYGIPAKIRISGGQEVNCYKKVTERVRRDVEKYAVCMTQAECGFQVAAEIVPHSIADEIANRFSNGAAMAQVVVLLQEAVEEIGPAIAWLNNPNIQRK